MTIGIADLVGAIDEGVIVWAPDGSVKEANEAAARILGVPLEGLLTSSWRDEGLVACDADERPLANRDLAVPVAFRTGERVIGHVFGMRYLGGELRWMSWNAVPVAGQDGAVEAVVCTFTDVTDQRRTDAQFRAMVDRSLNVIALIDQDGILTFVNAAAERNLGRRPDEIVDRPVLDVIHPGDHDLVRAELGHALAGKGAARRFDVRLASAGGDWRPFEAQATPTPLADGRSGLQVSARPIGEQRRAERDVRELTARLEALLAGLPVGIAFVDATGHGTVINPALKAIFGFPGDVPPGETPRDTLDRLSSRLTDPDRFLKRIEEVVSAGRPVYDDELHFVDGRIALRHYVPITADGEPLGHAWLYRDVTAERRAEDELLAVRDEAVRVASRRSEFLATMSHEIRTPLNGMLGAAELLCDTPLGAEQRDLVGMIAHAGGGLRAIIDEILDFSRIEAGKLPVHERPFAPREVVEAVRGVVTPSVLGRPVTVTSGVDASVPAEVVSDPDRVRQVLLNLAGNAVKFTPSGTVALHVGVSGDELVLTVSDTGPGIPEAERERLFQPFTQVDASPTRSHGGTGLGLAITHRVVTLLGGTIAVESEVGAGSAFVVRLPLRVPETPSVAAAPAAPVLEAPTLAGRVLLADDNDLNRRILARQLERLGLEVTAVTGGREAIEAAVADRFDVVLMDCRMPEVDGYMAARGIRDGGGPSARTPIAAVTANALPEDRERCHAAGMDAVVTKPIALDDLRETLTGLFHTGEPVVDEQALAQMREELMDDGLLAAVISTYAAELDSRAAAIRSALEVGDAARLAEAAHVLASPSATIGLVRLGELCRRLESEAEGPGAAGAFREVDAEIGRAADALPDLLALLS